MIRISDPARIKQVGDGVAGSKHKMDPSLFPHRLPSSAPSCPSSVEVNAMFDWCVKLVNKGGIPILLPSLYAN
jgi:hypothetical protein